MRLQETGLYYLQSRYYDPEVCRFINADEANNLAANGDYASYNLFAYCGNNPVLREDAGGVFWNIVAGAVIGAAISAGTQILTNIIAGDAWSEGVGMAALGGAISGGLAATGLGRVGQIVGNAVISAVGETINQVKKSKSEMVSFGEAITAVGIATLGGIAAGAIGGKGARVKGSSYRLALDNLDNVASRVANGTYSSFKTAAKVFSRAQGKLLSIAKDMTLITSARFYAGAQVAQGTMKIYNSLA